MKIEIGESLIASWLKHIKQCKIVEINWKASMTKWELMNNQAIDYLMRESQKYFYDKYGYNVYKGTTSYKQLIQQAEIDVLGINFSENNKQKIYAVDVAFHENGLSYGGKEETVTRVIKKIIRTVMCIYGCFGYTDGTVVFASPKINNATYELLIEGIKEVIIFLSKLGFNYEIELLANNDFKSRVLDPVLDVASNSSDNNELFIRSVQLINLFSNKGIRNINTERKEEITLNEEKNVDNIKNNDNYKDIKIGRLVRSTLPQLIRNKKVTKEEIEKMQTKEYSKEVFHLNYPILRKAKNGEEKPLRYYKEKILAYGEEYFICSEWFETTLNNDRPHYLKWLALRK